VRGVSPTEKTGGRTMGVSLQFGFSHNPFAAGQQSKFAQPKTEKLSDAGASTSARSAASAVYGVTPAIEAIPFSMPMMANYATDPVFDVSYQLNKENGWTASQSNEFTPFPYWPPTMPLTAHFLNI